MGVRGDIFSPSPLTIIKRRDFMLYTEFIVGDNTYKLRLNTRNIVALEK